MPSTENASRDEALMRQVAQGSAEALGLLHRRFARLIFALAVQTLARAAAADLVQEVFLVVWRHAGRFDPERPFAPWCFGIVRRLASNRRAREQRRWRLARLSNWVRSEASLRDQEPVLIASLDAAAAKRAMNMLSPMQRACFELVDVQGLSNEEVARMHGISASTVRQHVFRARAILRSLLTTPRKQDS